MGTQKWVLLLAKGHKLIPSDRFLWVWTKQDVFEKSKTEVHLKTYSAKCCEISLEAADVDGGEMRRK